MKLISKAVIQPQIESTSKVRNVWSGVMLVLLGYSLLALVITFPFGVQLGNRIFGIDGDSFQNLWYMWWYREAVLSGQDPTRTHLMYGLLPSVQVLLSSVFNAVWLMPLETLYGPLLAYNLGIFVSFPLAGLCAYLLAREFSSNWLAAFVAGFLYAFSTYHLYRAEAHLGLVTVQWLPFYAWRLFRLRRHPNWRNALLAGLGLALCALSDLYYLGYFVLPFTGLFLVWSARFERKTFLTRPNLLYFGLALGLGFASLLPFYWSFFQLDSDVAQAVKVRSADAGELSADLLGFFLPDPRNPTFGGLTGPIYKNFAGIFPIEQAVYPGYVLLVAGLAITTPWLKRLRSRDNIFWLVVALGAFILALGPRLHFNGQAVGPAWLPYAWIYGKLPFLTNFRAPARFGVVLGLALAVLAAVSLGELFGWLQKRGTGSFRMAAPLVLASGLMGFAILENMVYPWPLQLLEVKIPEIYPQIAAEPGDFLVLELPLANLSPPLYYQTIHKKSLVGGYPSRISNRMSLSFDKVPYLGMFNPAESSAVMDGTASKGQPDIFPLDISFRQALQQNNIRYITLRNYPGGQRFFNWMQPYLESNLGAPTFRQADNKLLAWRVEPAISPLSPPVPGSYRYRLGDGWQAGLGKGEDGKLLRLVEQDAQLTVEAGKAGPVTLQIKLTPYIRPQLIEVRLNGQLVGQIDGSKEWKSIEASLPNLNFKFGPNLLELHSGSGCLVAADYIPNSPDRRCISFAVHKIGIEN